MVSKAVFEREARVGGRLLGVGEVWSTERYASRSPGLEALAGGGDLVLVTVRPGDVAWLVAVLRAPRADDAGWAAAPNTAPIRDVTAALPALRFASGKGVSAGPGKLGMSLQTPRGLVAGDLAALGLGGGAPPSPAGWGALRLEGYRRRRRWKACTAAERRQLAAVGDELASDLDEGFVELLDVVDGASGAPRGLLALWPYGSGALLDPGGELLADVVQHHLDPRGDDALRNALAAAWARDAATLGVVEKVTFAGSGGGSKAARPPPAPAGGRAALLERVRAARRAVTAGSGPGDDAVWALATEVFGLRKPPRRLPHRRWGDLDETERETLLLVHEGYRGMLLGQLGRVGLPSARGGDVGRLDVFVGAAEGGVLDRVVRLEGAEHPVWALVSDAVHEQRPVGPVLDALASLPVADHGPLWTALAAMAPGGVLTGGAADPPPGAQPGSPAALGAHAARWVRFTSALAVRLGDAGEGAARAWLAENAHWVDRWVDLRAANPHTDLPFWFPACVALGAVARRARADGGWPEPALERWLEPLVRCSPATYPLAVVLEDLPPERASALAVADLALMARFPSPAAAAAAVRQLEARGGGPWLTGLFVAAITAIGPAARPALEAALAAGTTQAAAVRKALKTLR